MAHDVEQFLITESGRIGPDIYQRTLNTSPWLKLVKQGAWPDEMGSTISVLTYERSLPVDVDGNYDPSSWSQISDNTGGSGGNCVPTGKTVKFAQTKRTYSIYQTALQSQDICVNDLRNPVYRKQQLGMAMNILTENTSQVWIERFRDEYVRLAEHKVVLAPNASGSSPEGTSSFPLQLPTSKLTPGLLKRFYMKLIRDGAGTNALSRENARPVFGLICSSEISDDLIRTDDAVRNDFRWSSRANELLAPLGVERSYNGWYHMIDDFAPRYNFTGGAWVRVWPYDGVAAELDGTFKQEISSAYENADAEDVIVFHTDVFKNLVPKPITSPGGNTQFDAVNYRGDFKWRNILDRTENPDGTIGYFRGVFQCASEPIFPQYGYVIRVLRCNPEFTTATCS